MHTDTPPPGDAAATAAGQADFSAAASAPGPAWPPAGFVDRDGACRMFGVSRDIWKRWCAEGRVGCGAAVAKPSGGWCKIYPVAALERLRDEMRAAHLRLPAGFVGRDEAMRLFNVTPTTWKRWQRAGRVPPGEWANVPGKRPRVRVFALDELRRIREAFDREGQPYPDPDLPGCYRVPAMSFHTTLCEAIIDAADLPRVAGRRWNWVPRNDGAMPAVVLADHATGHVPMRRIILGIEDPDLIVTHANGDPLDCRRANLVVRDPSQQAAAARKRATYGGQPCTSRFKGVSWDGTRGGWRATVKKDDVRRFLGRFRDEVAAAEAYDEAARELFGEHARLNFPDGVDAFLAAEAARAGIHAPPPAPTRAAA